MKYLIWVFVLLVLFTIFRAAYPTVKSTDLCMGQFEKSLPSRLLLTRTGNSESTRNYCVKTLGSINGVNSCLEKTKKEEKIKGLTDFIKKINEVTTISGEEIYSATKAHNTDCNYFPELLIN